MRGRLDHPQAGMGRRILGRRVGRRFCHAGIFLHGRVGLRAAVGRWGYDLEAGLSPGVVAGADDPGQSGGHEKTASREDLLPFPAIPFVRHATLTWVAVERPAPAW